MLTLLASSAWADWAKMGETDEGSFYIDTASVLRDGHWRQVWELTDLKQRDEGGEMSRRIRVQYDCKRGHTQVLSISTHWEPMAAGARGCPEFCVNGAGVNCLASSLQTG